MPKLTLIAPSEIISTRKGRPASENYEALLEYAVNALNEALESKEALLIELEQDERPVQVQNAFRDAAEKNGTVTTKFVTAPDGHRPYKVRSGEMKTEVYKFYVRILPVKEAKAS